MAGAEPRRRPALTPRHALLLALLLSGLVLPAARGQEGGAVEVWDQPRSVVAHMVQNDTTLVIRGTTITLDGGLVVAERGRLILEPGPDGAPAVLRPGDRDGWAALVLGEMVVDSRGGQPAVLEGIGGEAAPTKGTILLAGGVTVSGRLDADGLVVRNYTGAFNVGLNGTIRVRNATFSSPVGMALVATYGAVDAADARFEGAGGGAWVATDGELHLARATFQDVPTAVTHLGDAATLEDVSVRNASEGCVRASKGSLVVRGLSCEGFGRGGVLLTRPAQGLGRPRAELSGLRLSSTNASAPALLVEDADAVDVSDSVLGPVGTNGVQASGIQPTLRNVTFRGAGGYNVFLLNLPTPPRREGLVSGEPGVLGHAYVGARFVLRALGADGQPADKAKVDVLLEPDDAPVAHAILTPAGQTNPFVLDVFKVDREGRERSYSYHIKAEDADGAHAWERTGYVPDGDPLLFQIVEPRVAKETPGAPLALLLAAVACGAWALGRARRR